MAEAVEEPDAASMGIMAIASPLAGEKLTAKVLKLVKKASKGKSVYRGIKEVNKALRSSKSGMVVIAGNISPMDVISHIPILCEEQGVPYIYVPRKEDLGAAAATKRPTSVVLVQAKEGADFKEYYDEVLAKVRQVQIAF